MSRNRDLVESFLMALEQLDPEPIRALLANDVVEVLPFAAAGGIGPAGVFDGKDAVMNVQNAIVTAFSSVTFGDRQLFESTDGESIFLESLGQRVQKSTGNIYRNRYVMKFEFRDSLISRITEYSNPVTFARFFDLPVG